MKRKPRKTPLQLARSEIKRLRAEVADLRDELGRYDEDYRDPVDVPRGRPTAMSRLLDPVIRKALEIESKRIASNPLLEMLGMSGKPSRVVSKRKFSYDIFPQ